MIIVIMMIGFCFGLLAQPRPFDPDYYKDSLRVKKSDEFKKLEDYREKYKKLQLNETIPSYPYKEYFYHRGINLDSVEEYNKLGLFKELGANDIDNKILRPIIVIGKLTSFERGRFNDIATFDVIKMIRGREYYNNFPTSIKCYSDPQGTFTNVFDSGSNVEYVTKPKYFGKIDPLNGDEFILYLDIFKHDIVNQWNRNPDEFNRLDVFYYIEAEYLDFINHHYVENDKKRGKVKLENILIKLRKIDELKKGNGNKNEN